MTRHAIPFFVMMDVSQKMTEFSGPKAKGKGLKSVACRWTAADLAYAIAFHVRLRRRYFFTRKNRLRARYVVSPLLAAFLFCIPSLLTSTSLQIPEGVSPRTLSIASVGNALWAGDQAKFFHAFYQKRLERYVGPETNQLASTENNAGAAAETESPSSEKTVKLAKGDTLSGLLQEAGVAADEAYQMVSALKKIYDPRSLRPGQKVSVRFENENGDLNTAHVEMPIDAVKSVSLEKREDGTYDTQVVKKPVQTKMYVTKLKVETSLYGSAAKVGVPSSVIADMIRIYSYDVDFQRELHKGDLAEAMYEQIETKDGDFVKSGDLLYARLIIGGRSIPIYRYEQNGIVDYYTAEGKSVRKTLMRTPVDGARISSGFGMRIHPVLGFTKMHKGIDFAAPVGTPIYASGNGIVVKAGPFSSYGNYVRLRHNSGMETAYAHMSRFGSGIRPGVRVAQGQVIGYVGRTGRVTGAHLHYEVLVNNKQVNPASIAMAQADGLTGKQLASFKAHVAKMDQQFNTLGGSLKYAARRDDVSASMSMQ